MKKNIIILALFLLLLSSILVACSEEQTRSTKSGSKLTVYTTVYPLQYFTERIAGDLVSVESIYPPGADEHTFEPTQRDMMKVSDSQLFLYIGLGLEGFVEKAKNTLKNEGVQFIAVGENINLKEIPKEADEDGHHHGDIDPHVWLDPVYANELALAIKDALVTKLPKEKNKLNENYEKLSNELVELNSSFQTTIENSKHKDMIVSHAAFGYWEQRYGLHQISISGLSTANEPSQKELEKIVKLTKEKHIHYFLFEQNVSTKLGEILQKEVGAKSLTLHNLATLTEENIKNKDTYFTIMEHNLQSLSKALND